MLFSSNFFVLYFLPIFFLAFFASPAKIKNYVALLGSVVFYAWGAPKFIFILAGSTLADFFIAQFIAKSENKNRRLWLGLGVFLNVSLLCYFKYANFFVRNLDHILHHFNRTPIHLVEVALPIGISFFTFHKLSYLIDVYRKADKPLDKISNYFLYILLFPQLIAGPIIRFHEISNQIANRHLVKDKIDDMLAGLLRFIIGLAKKVLIANVIGKEADIVFGTGMHDLTTINCWIGIIAYTFQIYFDFSGYSDMAIGLGRMMGFVFPENFNNPYISQNITEFWRRWHISLSNWMRDYLYIPLGGNRAGKARMFFNLWVVFLISGLWHGAAWNFIIWGVYHGTLLIMDRLFLIKLTSRFGKYTRILLTFFLIMIGWVLFRSPNLRYALGFIQRMFVFSGKEFPFLSSHIIIVILLAIVFCFVWSNKKLELLQRQLYEPGNAPISILFKSIFAFGLLCLCVFELSASGFNPFIYFRF